MANNVVYDLKTGERLERFPIDARTMVASGEYVYELPEGFAPGKSEAVAAEPVAVPAPAVAEPESPAPAPKKRGRPKLKK